MNRAELETKLTLEIISTLNQDIKERGKASLLVSGGSTPINLFKKLSNTEIDWSKVIVSLVDERFVPDNHPDQNGELVKKILLQNKAEKAKFIPLIMNASNSTENIKQVRAAFKKVEFPISVVILGMGTDGHTASLFPNSPQLDIGIDLTNKDRLIITHPVTAPHERITFTREALLNTKRLILHCYGEEKKQILKDAERKQDYRAYPIVSFMHQPSKILEVFWAK
ncbi:MAG: 6-phosphogluconolactonase [Salibacteraceae bacterium]|jgi:6-phosphogluconolactonase